MSDPSRRDVLAQALREIRELKARQAAAEAQNRAPIAVVGLGCRLPGADDPAALWRLLCDGVDATGEVPPGRWAEPDPPGLVTRRGGFLAAVDGFDAGFFGISPREAQSLDPQQRLFLEVVWEALEHAAIAPDRLRGARCGVYCGITQVDYAQILAAHGDLAALGGFAGTGVALNFAAGRVARTLDLRGPALAVDTACSSSLMAVHLAVGALRRGAVDLALAGGVNLILHPAGHAVLSQARALSPGGRCRTFDAAADGYARAEGCGVVVLAREDDARRAGQRILARIRGSAAVHDGASAGLTVPSGEAQAAVIAAACADAGVDPASVAYVEAHGTGTALGDPIELRALAQALGRGRAAPLLVGALKTNLGHAESAAGVAGLIKVVLALAHGELPPQRGPVRHNPAFDWDRAPIEVVQARRAWPEGPRLAGVSAFGASGTDVHVILDAAPPQDGADDPDDGEPELLVLSAATPAALAGLAGRHAAALPGAKSLASACWTAAVGRAALPHAIAVVARSAAEAASQLAAFAGGGAASSRATDGPGDSMGAPGTDEPAAVASEGGPGDPTGVPGGPGAGERSDTRAPRATRAPAPSVGRRPPAPVPVAFVFAGQGTRPELAPDLLTRPGPVREALERCDAILRAHRPGSLIDLLAPRAGESPLDETAWAQPALFALEWALLAQWRAWGVEPRWVLGHSLGAYVAACAAGVLDLEDALGLVARRAALMQQTPPGAMAAVFAGEEVVRRALAEQDAGAAVAVAAINGPREAVISGDAAAVAAILRALGEAGVRGRTLAVRRAFHSPLMDGILGPFEAAVRELRLRPPDRVLVSDASGRPETAAWTDPAAWRRHLRETVRFADALGALQADGCALCVELGADAVLGRRADAGLRWIPSLRRGAHGRESLLAALGALAVAGVRVDLAAACRGRRRIDLPTYPFERRRAWVGPGGRAAAPGEAHEASVREALLGRRVPPQDGMGAPDRANPRVARAGDPPRPARAPGGAADGALFEAEWRADGPALLRDHRVFGRCVVSGAVAGSVALAAARELDGDGPRVLSDLDFRAPIVLPEVGGLALRTRLTRDGDRLRFSIESRERGRDRVHVTGRIQATAEAPPPPRSIAAIRGRCREALDGEAFYARFWRPEHHSLGPSYRTLAALWRRDGEALARLRAPLVADDDGDGDGAPQDPLWAAICLAEATGQLLMPAVPDFAAVFADRGDTYLGSGMTRSVQHDPSIAAAAWIHARLDAVGDDGFVGEVAILDEEGRALVVMEGLGVRRIDADQLRRATARAAIDDAAAALDGPSEGRPGRLHAWLEGTAAGLIGGACDPDTPLARLGFDSLAIVELLERVEAAFGLRVEPEQLRDETLSGLHGRILAAQAGAAGEIARSPTPDPGGAPSEEGEIAQTPTLGPARVAQYPARDLDGALPGGDESAQTPAQGGVAQARALEPGGAPPGEGESAQTRDHALGGVAQPPAPSGARGARPEEGRWRRVGAAAPAAGLRLFCLPHAGASAMAFQPWREHVPPGIEVHAAQLPGRWNEPGAPLTDLGALVGLLLAELRPRLAAGPWALFGASLGGLLALEIAHALRREGGPQPTHLVVAGTPAPEGPHPLAAEADALRAALAGGGDLPALVRRGLVPEGQASADLLPLLLPALRADLELAISHRHRHPAPLGCPLLCLLGVDDRTVERRHVTGWVAHTDATFTLCRVPGGHLFYRDEPVATWRALTPWLRGP